MACQCARCEFDRENDGISFGNEMGAIQDILLDSPAPDEQARAEVFANLNPGNSVKLDVLATEEILREGYIARPSQVNKERIPILEAERDKALKDSEEWMVLYSIAICLIDDFRDDVREMRTDLARSEDLVEFLKAAVQQYASHIWNDIKNIVDAR